MRVVIQENNDKMCKWAADYIAAKIKAHNSSSEAARPFVLGLPTGSSPIGVYKELARQNQAGELSFANVVTFNMDEYLGLPHEHDQSYWYFMHENFFDHLVDMKPENINILNGMTEDPEKECADYEAGRKILCKRFSTRVKDGAGKQGGFWPESLDYRKPWRSERYARRRGVNAGLAAVAY